MQVAKFYSLCKKSATNPSLILHLHVIDLVIHNSCFTRINLPTALLMNVRKTRSLPHIFPPLFLFLISLHINPVNFLSLHHFWCEALRYSSSRGLAASAAAHNEVALFEQVVLSHFFSTSFFHLIVFLVTVSSLV